MGRGQTIRKMNEANEEQCKKKHLTPNFDVSTSLALEIEKIKGNFVNFQSPSFKLDEFIRISSVATWDFETESHSFGFSDED